MFRTAYPIAKKNKKTKTIPTPGIENPEAEPVPGIHTESPKARADPKRLGFKSLILE